MSPIDAEIINAKLSVIPENLKALEPIKGMNRDEYLRDIYKRKATERLLQEMIEAAIDINVHMAVGAGHSSPADYYQSFIQAGELGMISPELAEKLAPAAGLRNRLIHEYDKIDSGIVLEAVATTGELFPRYVKEIFSALPKGD
jgi:uncharacterized protein YutE (UPF0331/DUF86 family)